MVNLSEILQAPEPGAPDCPIHVLFAAQGVRWRRRAAPGWPPVKGPVHRPPNVRTSKFCLRALVARLLPRSSRLSSVARAGPILAITAGLSTPACLAGRFLDHADSREGRASTHTAWPERRPWR